MTNIYFRIYNPLTESWENRQLEDLTTQQRTEALKAKSTEYLLSLIEILVGEVKYNPK